MKALVTGATGFIGSAITRQLVEGGAAVKVLVRETSDTRNIDGLEVERVRGDICDAASVRAALDGCDTLFHAAAYFTHWAKERQRFYDVNVGGTRATLRAALDVGVEKVVYTSTNNAVGAYGPTPSTEDAQFNYWSDRGPLLDLQVSGRGRGVQARSQGAATGRREPHARGRSERHPPDVVRSADHRGREQEATGLRRRVGEHRRRRRRRPGSSPRGREGSGRRAVPPRQPEPLGGRVLPHDRLSRRGRSTEGTRLRTSPRSQSRMATSSLRGSRIVIPWRPCPS